jgi:hypothetical protein
LNIKLKCEEEITFTEGELINNADGSFSINDSLFTMPYENVTITVRTKPTLNVEVIKKDILEAKINNLKETSLSKQIEAATEDNNSPSQELQVITEYMKACDYNDIEKCHRDGDLLLIKALKIMAKYTNTEEEVNALEQAWRGLPKYYA